MKFKQGEIAIFSDVEGPILLGDIAFEITVALAKTAGLGEEIGRKFFKYTSIIDDLWGDFGLLAKIDPTYSAGHTIKVILPFLKAMGANEEWLYEFSRKNIRAVPGAEETLKYLSYYYNVWLISTSYEWYIQALCDLIGFDSSQAHFTSVENFDEITLEEEEKKLLLDSMREVAGMEPLRYNNKTGEIDQQDLGNYQRVTDFIWKTVHNMPVGKLLKTVHPVGQAQKREVAERICKEYNIPPEKVMVIGDSQTDVEIFKFAKPKGFSLAFNAKGTVCDIADVMYIGGSTLAIIEVAKILATQGKEEVFKLCSPCYHTKDGGFLAKVTPEILPTLKEKSLEARKKIRGVEIGELS